VKNLWAIETVDSEKKARIQENALIALKRDERLKVFIQVNTSGEERNNVLESSDCREIRRRPQ
jgi:uncharacterized pyridoxal phosphate-containing UPF0001 family protein